MKRMNVLQSFIILLSLVYIGCATPYQKDSLMGGFSETQLNENTFLVNFRGNGYTNRQRARDFTLLRSAELALENGFQYFIVVDSSNYLEQSSYTTPGTATTTGNISGTSYGNVYGNSYGYNNNYQLNTTSNYQLNSTTTYTPPTTHIISKPGSTNKIVCFKNKPDINGEVFNAQLIYSSLQRQYGLDKVEEPQESEEKESGY